MPDLESSLEGPPDSGCLIVHANVWNQGLFRVSVFFAALYREYYSDPEYKQPRERPSQAGGANNENG